MLLALVVLCGCAVMNNNNYMPPNLPEDSLVAIATDIAPIIAEGNPAKSTTFILQQDDFGRALAQQLGKLGYEVMLSGQTNGQQPENADEIQYTIDWASPKSMYLALTINNRQRYIRTYTTDQGILIPDKTKIIGQKDE